MRYLFTKLPATLFPQHFATAWQMKAFFDNAEGSVR
jgi:hypothetical protein